VPDEKLIGPATGLDFPFIEACFKAGLLEYWSAVSVHPYRNTDPETVANDYCRLRELIQEYRPQPKSGEGVGAAKEIPIIFSEWGYSAAWRDFSEEKQSALLAREMLTNVANRIPISIWYDWRDDGADPAEAEHHFGLVRNAHQPERMQPLQPTAAYAALKTVSEFLSGYTFEKRLAVGINDVYVLVFVKDGNRRIAAWTTSTGKHRVVIPLGAGSFMLTKYTGEPSGAINATKPGPSIEISTAPLYIAASN
jgi:hypothetical protein